MSASPAELAGESRTLPSLWRAFLLVGLAPCFLISCVGIAGRGEKQIRYELSHRFAVDDPQFLRSMGQLLGPAILPGNRVTSPQGAHRG